MTMFTIFNQSRNILDQDNEDNTTTNIWNLYDALALSTLKKLIKKCWYLLIVSPLHKIDLPTIYSRSQTPLHPSLSKEKV